MTTPSGGFEYNDDSVVARVSVDIPDQAVTDISQLTVAMSAMRTELEAISRAQNDWLSYLQQMPVIVEQSNQALRNQITLMERMSYLQGEIGPGGAGGAQAGGGGEGGGRSVGGGDGGGGGGAAGVYSTAAPAGYQDPFRDMSSGLGGRGGAAASSEQQVQEQMQAMQGQDPRTLANMAAARGMAVNPATIGMIGGIVAGALGNMGGVGGGAGTGAPASGSTSPQQGNAKRTAGGPPNPNAGGQPTGSQGQNEPGEPGDDDPAWRHFTHAVMNEVKAAGGVAAAGGIGGILGTATKIGGKMGAGRFLKGAGGRTLLGAAAVGGAGIVSSQIQNIGENITEYQQLGSVRGGDYMTGIGMELENRIRAIDPFVNLPQTREAMQAAYGAGFQGESVAEVQSQAITNFKELGMSMQETARMMQAAMHGEDRTDSAKTLEERTRLDAVVRTMKELSEEGGLSAPERRASLAQALVDLKPLGMDSATIERGELLAQEAFGDTMGLGETIGKTNTGIMNNQTALAIFGQRKGITGIVPSAMPRAVKDAGFTATDVTVEIAKEVAQNVSGLEPKMQRVGVFMDLMNQYGAELTFETAEELYDKVAGGADPLGDAREKLSKPKLPDIPGMGLIKGASSLANKVLVEGPMSIVRGIHDRFSDEARSLVGLPSEEAERTAELFANDRPSNQFSPSGSNAANLPTSSAQVPAVNTTGQVSGNITITVDQNGRVSAPQSIQLTGTQQSALSGWGSAQVNNISPGESHATPPLGGGG